MFFGNLFSKRPILTPDIEGDLSDGELWLELARYVYGSDYVGHLPSYFFLIHRGKGGPVVGQCDLRIGDNDAIPYAGHIGYRIYQPYRGHGYAQKASRILLNAAYNLGIEEITITCDPDNIASRKTLEYLGGDYIGCFKIPEDHVCYKAGDREKCRFIYLTADFRGTLILNDNK